jgi:hypothetical protein
MKNFKGSFHPEPVESFFTTATASQSQLDSTHNVNTPPPLRIIKSNNCSSESTNNNNSLKNVSQSDILEFIRNKPEKEHLIKDEYLALTKTQNCATANFSIFQVNKSTQKKRSSSTQSPYKAPQRNLSDLSGFERKPNKFVIDETLSDI